MCHVPEGAVASAGAASPAAGKEGGKKEGDTFSFKGQVIAAIVVTAVAGNIIGARRFRYAPRLGYVSALIQNASDLAR